MYKPPTKHSASHGIIYGGKVPLQPIPWELIVGLILAPNAPTSLLNILRTNLLSFTIKETFQRATLALQVGAKFNKFCQRPRLIKNSCTFYRDYLKKICMCIKAVNTQELFSMHKMDMTLLLQDKFYQIN